MSDYSIRKYRQSLLIGLIGVVKELFPSEQLKISHSILDGVYCELENSVLSSREIQTIEDRLLDEPEGPEKIALQDQFRKLHDQLAAVMEK